MTQKEEFEKIMDGLRAEKEEIKNNRWGISSKGNSILTVRAQLCHYNSLYRSFFGHSYKG